jgi:hypothetical protein
MGAGVGAGCELYAALYRLAKRPIHGGGWLHQAKRGTKKEGLERQGSEESEDGCHCQCCEAEHCFHVSSP